MKDGQVLMRRAVELAHEASARGNRPFGAVLVDAAGEVLAEGQNTVVSENDPTGHAELNLLRQLFRRISPEALKGSTLYASGEPCVMCAGAIVWSGISRLVYGLSVQKIYEEFGESESDPAVKIPCRQILREANREIEVVGPTLEKW